MKLSQEIKETEIRIAYHENILSVYKSKLYWLTDASEMSNKEVLMELSKMEESNIFSIKITKKEYEYILGGDGRSRPWSETRKGKVLSFYSKNYLSKEQLELIQITLKNLYTYDKLIINDNTTRNNN